MGLGAVLAALRGLEPRRVLDLGCGEGKLIALLLKEPTFDEIIGMDVSHRALDIAEERLHLDRLAPKQRERLRLIHGSLTYRDRRLEGYDAAAVVEVIEHLDQPRLKAFERVLFEFAAPRGVVLTTPTLVPELTSPDGGRALPFCSCPRQGTPYICAGTTWSFAPAIGHSRQL